MKRVLILYGAYGGGHLSAAKTICKQIENQYKNEVDVVMVDCIEYINKYVNKVSTEAYKELAKKVPWVWKHVYKSARNGPISHISTTTNKLMSYKLNLLMKELKPDLIISTHPFATQMCAMLKETEKIDCKLATILTDYHIHDQWLVLSQYNDYFFVANPQMKSAMIAEGIHDQKIFVTGIPISDRFLNKFDKEEIHKDFGLTPDKETVLFFAGGEFGLGRNNTVMMLKVLIRLFKDLQVVAISGKNRKMKKKFQELIDQTNSSDRVKLLEYTDKVPELMSISSAVITKAGGLTVTECLASNLPMIIINPIPGQEEENAEFLEKHGVALWIKKGDSIARTLKNLSRDPERLAQMVEKTKILAKPNSAKKICKILMDEIL